MSRPATNAELQQRLGELEEENQSLRTRLEDAEQTLEAIREGQIDALVVDTPEGPRVFSLQGAEHPYRILIEQMQEGAATLAPDGTIRYCNRALALLLQRPLETIVGTRADEHVHAPDRAAFARLLRAGPPCRDRGDVGLIAADGRIVPVQVGLTLVADGGEASIAMIVTDLTERKRAAQVLASAQFVRRLVDQTPVGVAVVDRDLRYLLANPAYRAIGGGAPLVGRTIAKAFPPAVAHIVEPHVRRVLDSGQTLEVQDQEAPIRGRTWWNVSATPLHDPAGNVEAVLILTEEVTARQQAEQALRQSEEQYRTLFSTLLEGFCIIEVLFDADDRPVDYRFLVINPAFEGLTGLQHAEGKRMRQLAPEHEAHWFEVYGKVALTGEPVRFVNEAKALGRWYEVHAYRVGAPDRRNVAILFNDITERRRAEQALRESERLYHAIGESIDYGIWICDAQGRNTYTSESLLKLVGITQDQCADFGWGNVLHPDDVEATLAAWKECVRSGGPWYREHRYRGADGQWHPILACGVPVRNERGEVTAWAGINLDIRRLKAAEQALRESEARFKAIASSTPDHILVQDRDLRYLFVVNPQLGLTERDMIGKTDHDFLCRQDADRLTQIKRRVLETGAPVQFEAPLKSASGEQRFFRGSYVPSFAADGQIDGLIGYFENVTERKELEQQRDALLDSERAARTEAERANRVKDEFISTLSHELRNPLNAILGWAQLLRRPKRSAADVAEGMEIIESSARALADMISDLLDLSRITTGKLRLDVQTVDLHAVIAAAIAAAKPAIEAKGIHLQTALDSATGSVRGDPNRLQQVVWNLLSNAAKFTHRGGRVDVALRRIDSQVEVSVADTGDGIEPDFLPHLFERFRQEDASAAKVHGGLGLGLSIVQHLVELHGGTVEAASPGKGQGATFTVRLPVQAVIRAEPTLAPGVPGSPKPAILQYEEIVLDGLKVLAVDDECESLALVKRVLEERHAQVFTAASAADGLELVQQARPDVIVSDIGMPGEDGFQFMRRVRALGPDRGGTTPAVALTAFAGAEHQQRTQQAGYQTHLAKPVEVAQLIFMVAELAGRLAAVDPAPPESEATA